MWPGAPDNCSWRQDRPPAGSDARRRRSVTTSRLRGLGHHGGSPSNSWSRASRLCKSSALFSTLENALQSDTATNSLSGQSILHRDRIWMAGEVQSKRRQPSASLA